MDGCESAEVVAGDGPECPSAHLPADVSHAGPSTRPLAVSRLCPALRAASPSALLSGVCPFLEPSSCPSWRGEPPRKLSKSAACLPKSRGRPGRPFPRGHQAPLWPRPGCRAPPAPHPTAAPETGPVPPPAAVPVKPWTRGLWGGSRGPHGPPGALPVSPHPGLCPPSPPTGAERSRR